MKPVGAQAAGCKQEIAFRFCQGGKDAASPENLCRGRTFKLRTIRLREPRSRSQPLESCPRTPDDDTIQPGVQRIRVRQQGAQMSQPAPAFKVRRIDPDPHPGTRAVARAASPPIRAADRFRLFQTAGSTIRNPTQRRLRILSDLALFVNTPAFARFSEGGKMCGIAGLVGDFVPGLMDRMNAAQAHRGPDGRGLFERPELEVALGHVRLAVLDLSDFAAQPMISPDGRYVLVYNGEIYNFAALQQELTADGRTGPSLPAIPKSCSAD